MHVADYQDLARRTAKPLPILESWQHCAAGCSSDMGEVVSLLKSAFVYRKPMDKKDLTKELGDVTWFISYGCDILHSSLVDIVCWRVTDHRFMPERNMEDGAMYWGLMGMKAAGDLSELVAQRHHEMKYQLSDSLAKLYLCVVQVADAFDISIADVFEQNILKLRARYPEGYSDQAAIARLDMKKEG